MQYPSQTPSPRSGRDADASDPRAITRSSERVRSPLTASAEMAGRMSIGSRVAVRVSASALLWGASAGVGIAVVLLMLGFTEPIVLAAVIAAALASAIASFIAVRSVFARRLSRVASFVEEHARGGAPASPGLVEEGDEELARIAGAVNRLLASVRDGASGRTGENSAEASAREMRLAEDLARKTEELERRLQERSVLFDVLRESTSSQNLESVLDALVSRLGPVGRFREVAVLLREPDGSFAVRAAWGFEDPAAVLGRSVQPGEGLTGEAARAGMPIVVRDVGTTPEYLAFWGEVPRTGSFMTTPIRLRGDVIGMLATTRPPESPLRDVDTRYVGALADQAALAIHNAQLFAKLEELSTHDELTKLPNRRYFDERLGREIADARRYGHPLSVLVVDIDHFKKLNDRVGHRAGDGALVAVARLLRESLREVDSVARWGGEEFAVVLSHTAEAEAIGVAEKLRARVTELAVEGAAEQPPGHLSVSIGVAELRPEDDAESVVVRADRGLYAAKRAGRDRVATVST